MAKSMTKKQLAAIKSIVSKTGRNKRGLDGYTHNTMLSKDSGKLAALDNYHVVLFDDYSDEDLSVIKSDPKYNWTDARCLSVESIFDKWNEYIETGEGVYSEDAKDMMTLAEVVDMCKGANYIAANGNKCVVRKFENVELAVNSALMKETCTALGGRKDHDNTLLIYYCMSGIVVCGGCGTGLIMPVRI